MNRKEREKSEGGGKEGSSSRHITQLFKIF